MKKTLINELLENDIWNFWKKDWSKKLVVKWSGNRKSLKTHMKFLRRELGQDFGYERSVNGAIGLTKKIDLTID